MKIAYLLFFIAVFIPELVSAQGLTEALCDGPTCSACHLGELGNRLIQFIISLAFMLFAVLAVIAGFRLVTSQGNPSALQDAKDKFTNVFIGLLIVLSAAILVDTLIRGISDSLGGDVAGFGPWATIQCMEQTDPTVVEDFIKIEAGSIVSSETEKCAYDSATGGFTDCDALVANCDGIAVVDGADPTDRSVTCNIQSGLEAGADGVCSTPASDLTTVNLMGGSVQVHKDYAADVAAINATWESRGGSAYYKVNQLGGYAPRNIAGSSRCSFHSQGAAIDINQSQNPHCPTWSVCGGKNILITDMDEQSPPFYTVFTSNGWKWGGNWNSSKDAMHFSPSGK